MNLEDFSPRQRQVLILMLRGYSVHESAVTLGITRLAVKKARHGARAALGFLCDREVYHWAERRGYVRFNLPDAVPA